MASQGGFVPTDSGPAPQRKRIVICCDGTWQSSVSGAKNVPSNVTRLARSIARAGQDRQGNNWQQVVFYDAGLGTGVLSIPEKIEQGDLGMGFVGNVIEAYNFIVLNYSPGDEIFCFGFSRGAYTARAVAGLVNDIGVLSPRDMQDFPDLFALYQQNTDSHGFRKSKEYREWVMGVLSEHQPIKVDDGFQEPPRYDKPPHQEAPEASRVVQLVGVFETVGSLGVPDTPYEVLDFGLKAISKLLGVPKVGFHNVSLSPYIRYAFQTLALDEHRGPFTPTLWHLPVEDEAAATASYPSLDELRKARDEALADKSLSEEAKDTAWEAYVDGEMRNHLKGLKSDLLQVWFPGYHVNVGGGSKDLIANKKGDFEELSTISFAWMCEQIQPYIQFQEELPYTTVIDRMAVIQPALKELHEEQEKASKDEKSHWAITKAWKYVKSSLYHTETPNPGDVLAAAHRAVAGWGTGPIVDTFTGPMKIAGSIIRKPGRYATDDNGNALGETKEQIHPVVAYRQERIQQLAESLKGFQRVAEGKSYVWTNGTVNIPEYTIRRQDLFSRYVAAQDVLDPNYTASDFIGKIDEHRGEDTPERSVLETKRNSTA